MTVALLGMPRPEVSLAPKEEEEGLVAGATILQASRIVASSFGSDLADRICEALDVLLERAGIDPDAITEVHILNAASTRLLE